MGKTPFRLKECEINIGTNIFIFLS
ncbi:hypothetical protein [Anaerovorax odorimutans]